MAVAEAGVDAEPDAVAWLALAELAQHVDRTGIHRHVVIEDELHRGVVDHVSGEDESRRFTCAGVANAEGSLNLAARDRIDGDALISKETQ